MSSNSTEAFYEGKGIPVDLSDVEQTLDQLWGPAAQKAGGPELEHPSVTRLALANIVMVHLGADRSGLDETIEAITTHYPSRLIILQSAGGTERRLYAEVSAQCHLPVPGRPQVCSEQIILRSSSEGRDLLPGAVRTLLESDLHSVLWWCDDPRTTPELFEQLAGEATRVILDIPDPEGDPAGLAFAAKTDRQRLVRDIAWFGITPWRGLIADLFESTKSYNLHQITSVRIRTRSSDISRLPRSSAWLIAWLAGQLDWTPEAHSVRSTPESFIAAFCSSSGQISVHVELVSVPQFHAAVTEIAEVEFNLFQADGSVKRLDAQCDERGTCKIHVTAQDESGSNHVTLVRAPHYEIAHRVSSALLTDRTDPPYFRALPIALWLLNSSS